MLEISIGSPIQKNKNEKMKRENSKDGRMRKKVLRYNRWRREEGRVVVVGFGRINVEVGQNDELGGRLVKNPGVRGLFCYSQLLLHFLCWLGFAFRVFLLYVHSLGLIHFVFYKFGFTIIKYSLKHFTLVLIMIVT